MKKILTNLFAKLAMVAVLVGITATTAWGADVTDVINNAATSSYLGNTATSTWGTNFTITGTSRAEYYIHSMGTKNTTNALQWNSNGFLYMTKSPSGYKLKSVTITTTANKNIGVYAQNSAYSATPSENALNTLAATSSGATYSFTSDYSYIALKGTASSTSITSISIVWEEVASSAVATTTSISAAGITNTDVYVSTAAGSLSATVKDANNNTVSGASVTWSGNNDAVATINASTGAVTLVSAGSVTFTATYDGKSGEYLGSSATYNMTVTSSAPYVQPTEITITPNYTFWGKNAQFSGSTYDSLSGSKDNVSLEWSRGEGSTYANQNAMRFYKDNELTFKAPSGYEIKSIELSVSGTYDDLTFSPAGWDSQSTKWTGSSETVTMSRPSNASSYAAISKFTITIGKPSTDPVISANDIDITYDATGGNIAFTVENPVNGGSVSASTDANWLTPGSETTSPISFTCSANSENTARTATVTLTYTYDSNKTVTKDVTVTQAAAPVIYSTIPTLFAAATSTEKSVNVTFDSWVVSGVSTNGKNIYVTDNSGNGFIIYDASDMSGTYHAGDIISGTNVSCDLVLYNGAAEIKNLDASDVTITSGGTVSVSNIAMANLAAINSGALVSYSNLTCSISNNKYYLSDGTTTLQLYNQLFAFEALSAGKEYNITGVYLQYNSTKEIMPRSANDIQEIVSIIPTVTPATTSINVVAAGANGTLAVTYDNITDVTADVAFYQSNGTTSATYDWITASVNNENNVEYLVEENTSSEPRTAYMKVWAYDDNLSEVYSDLITITQAGFVADYATLPFSFDGGHSDIDNTAGLTQNGLGTSDYASSPKLKFDSADDWVILKINEAPGVLSFDIKGNPSQGSWSGTFKVQGSSDGVTYTDIQTYSSMSSSKQSETIEQMGSDVRYIKWILVTKDNGNVALGNINLAKVDLTPSITVSSNAINAPAAETQGTLDVTYKNIETGTGVEIRWFESDGTTPSTEPAWITADVNSSFNVDYLIEANTGAARTAYFIVYGLDSEANDVYSELVTVSQDAYVAPPTGENYALYTGEIVEGNYIIYYNGSAMNTTVNNDRLQYVDIEPNNNVITSDNAAIVWHIAPSGEYWTIYNADADAYAASTGAKNKAQMLADGTDDKALWTVSGTETYEFVNKKNTDNSVNSNLRKNGTYGFACYATSTGGALTLYKNVNDPVVTPEITLTLAANNGLYWGSFYNGGARYALPEGAKAYTLNTSHQLYLLGDGSEIPVGTAVIIIADSSSITLTKSTATDVVEISGSTNILVGADSAKAVSSITGTPYVLGIVGGTLGFYKYTGDKVPAMKAYYIVNQ